MRKINTLLILCTTIGAVLLSSTTAHALTISPPRLELSGNPGETVTGEFKVYNDDKNAKILATTFQNFEAKDETGQPTFTKEPTDLATWIHTVNQISVAHLERKTIPFTITIPANAEPGGYFAAVLLNNAAPEEEEPGGVGVATDLGPLILLQVNGTFKEGADILEFNTKTHSHLFTSLPVDFYYRFQNAGNSWIKPLGDIIIKNIFGGVSKIVPANPSGSNVLPKSIRRFDTSWISGKDPEIQDQNAVRPPESPTGFWTNVKHQWRYFAIGRFHADMSLTYGQDQQHAKSSVTFWIFPWQLIVTAAGLLIFLSFVIGAAVLIVYAIFKRKNKK